MCLFIPNEPVSLVVPHHRQPCCFDKGLLTPENLEYIIDTNVLILNIGTGKVFGSSCGYGFNPLRWIVADVGLLEVVSEVG
jgi:hypothetical protein